MPAGVTQEPQATDPLPTVEELTARRDAVAAATDIDDATKSKLVEVYNSAITQREELNRVQGEIAKLNKERQEAPNELKLQEKALNDLTSAPKPDVNVNQPLAKLREQQQTVEAQLNSATALVQQLSSEMSRRSDRLNQLPSLQSESSKQLQEVESTLASLPESSSANKVQNAQRTLLEIRKAFRKTEAAWMQLESQVYPETRQLWLTRQDVAEATAQRLQTELDQLRQAVGNAEKSEADRLANEVREAVKDLPEPLQDVARVNASLAEQNAAIVARLEQLRNELTAAQASLADKSQQYADTRKQAEAAGFSPAIGLLLRTQKSELPSRAALLERSRQRRQEVANTNFLILKWESDRRRIVDLEQAIETESASIDWSGISNGKEVRDEIKRLLTARLQLYRELIENARKQLNQVARLDAAELDLVNEITRQYNFISEHILWVRSTSPISPQLISSTPEGLRTLFNLEHWIEVRRTLWSDVQQAPWVAGIFLIVLLWFLLSRGRIKRRLAEAGQDAVRSTTISFMPTAQALLLSILLAAPLPLTFWTVGWRLTINSAMDGFVQVVGRVLIALAGFEMAIELIRQALRAKGLANLHFGWDPKGVGSTRLMFNRLRLVTLPAAAIVFLADWTGDQLAISTVGRLVLIAWLSAIAWVLLEGTRIHGPIMVAIRSSLRLPAMALWRWLVVGLPVMFAFASAAGFHYAAMLLSVKLVITIVMVTGLVMARAFLMRWLLISYRAAAMRQFEQRRRELAASAEAAQSMSDDLPLAKPKDAIQLSDINQQARSLINLLVVVAGIVGVVLTWNTLLPALRVLNQYHLWLSGLQTTAEGPVWVTVPDVLIAFAIMAITLLICRNITGLLNIVFIDKFAGDQGVRFAVAAISKYVLIILALLFSFRQMGIGWSSVQWLAAAVTVGLGFGLQEIFANFVSGIILLFERPIRIGDTVTISNVTGTVTQIRIRATTIQDWDNKELIIPNREFVTGNLVNWTLTNQNLRLVLNVGIAYGSNTRLATELLYRVARENPLVMSEPEPIVVFQDFGDSTLNFELRLFVDGLIAFRRLRHELNMAIDDMFRENGIEIAFPQRDLHLRTVSAPVIDGLRKA